MVSVIMINYIHENFIKQTVNGVLMQECDFEVELIIAKSFVLFQNVYKCYHKTIIL